MIDIINPNGKIINISSLSAIKAFENLSLMYKRMFVVGPNDIKMAKYKKEFFSAIEEGKIEEVGFYANSYAMSKLFLSSWTKSLTHQKNVKKKGIQCYSCSPGYVVSVDKL